MTSNASPKIADFGADASLERLLSALTPFDGEPLVIAYAGRSIRPGYHVTEVKAGAFVTLDCGGNPDRWLETILQIEDLGPEGVQDFMSVGKFRAILAKVASQIALDPEARLTVEVGPPAAPMQVFDLDRLEATAGGVVLALAPRPAICKPRHRAQVTAQVPCCGPRTESAACCA